MYKLFVSASSIHKNLKYYETLHSNDIEHTIVKRGLKESSHPFNRIEEVRFRTHRRDFRVILTPKRDVLHSNFKAYSVDGDGKETSVHLGKRNIVPHISLLLQKKKNMLILLNLDHDQFYDGRVFGEVESHANLHIEDGLITGSIHLPDETYHIEVKHTGFSIYLQIKLLIYSHRGDIYLI